MIIVKCNRSMAIYTKLYYLAIAGYTVLKHLSQLSVALHDVAKIMLNFKSLLCIISE